MDINEAEVGIPVIAEEEDGSLIPGVIIVVDTKNGDCGVKKENARNNEFHRFPVAKLKKQTLQQKNNKKEEPVSKILVAVVEDAMNNGDDLPDGGVVKAPPCRVPRQPEHPRNHRRPKSQRGKPRRR